MNVEKMRESQYNCKRRASEAHRIKLWGESFGVSERLQHIRVSNRKLNCLRWHNNESREHIIKKLDICRWLKEINHVFITEAIFLNEARADVVDLSEGVVYEILVSESEESCDEKVKKYPEEFEVVKI